MKNVESFLEWLFNFSLFAIIAIIAFGFLYVFWVKPDMEKEADRVRQDKQVSCVGERQCNEMYEKMYKEQLKNK